MNDREFRFWLRRATREQKLDALLWGQRTIMSAQNLEIQLELEQMAQFTGLNARIAKISDLSSSVKAAYDGAIAERDAAKAKVAELEAADATDQAAVDTAEANLAAAEAALETLKAIAAGTPVTLPPDTSEPGPATE